jgi:hypothetical protein
MFSIPSQHTPSDLGIFEKEKRKMEADQNLAQRTIKRLQNEP